MDLSLPACIRECFFRELLTSFIDTCSALLQTSGFACLENAEWSVPSRRLSAQLLAGLIYLFDRKASNQPWPTVGGWQLADCPSALVLNRPHSMHDPSPPPTSFPLLDQLTMGEASAPVLLTVPLRPSIPVVHQLYVGFQGLEGFRVRSMNLTDSLVAALQA